MSELRRRALRPQRAVGARAGAGHAQACAGAPALTGSAAAACPPVRCHARQSRAVRAEADPQEGQGPAMRSRPCVGLPAPTRSWRDRSMLACGGMLHARARRRCSVLQAQALRTPRSPRVRTRRMPVRAGAAARDGPHAGHSRPGDQRGQPRDELLVRRVLQVQGLQPCLRHGCAPALPAA